MTTETRAKQTLRDLADHIRVDPDVEGLRREIAEGAMEDDGMSPEEAAQFAEQFVATLLAMSPAN